MNRHHKKILLSLLAFLFVCGGGWLTFCNYVLRSFKKELVLFETNLKAKGFEISYAALDFQQHLFSLDVIALHPHFRFPHGFGIQAAKLEMSLRPWNWRQVLFSFPHTQDISLQYGVFSQDLNVKDATGRLRVTKQDTLEDLSFKIDSLALSKGGKPEAISLKNFSIALRSLSTPLDLDLTLHCEVKGMEELFHFPRAAKPITLTLDARFGGVQEKAGFPRSLEAWRDGGGVLDIRALRFTWLPFELRGSGTLTFDHEMYPLGAFSTRILGYQEGLNYLVAGNVIPRKNAAMVGFVLDMLSRSNSKGTREIDVPITLQDRKISVSGIPLWKS